MLAVALGIFLGTIDGSIVNIALPILVEDLGTTFAVVQWVVLAYLLTTGTLLLTVGRLADMIGKKRIYNFGFVVFTAASVFCGLAPTVGWLIAMRVLQGVGGAMIFGLGPAIITEAFPPGERGRALGISGTVVSLGIVLGPTLGGLILSRLSWHWIFLVNLPVGILGTWLVMRFVPATRPRGGQRFDFLGAGTLLVSLLALLLGLTLGQEWGFGDARVLGLFALFAVALPAFVLIELRVAQPMVDMALFRNRQFSANLATGFLVFVGLAGSLILLPFYLQNILGYPVQQAGLLLVVTPLALGISSPISGSLSDRFGTRPISVTGLAILMLGFFGLSTLDAQTGVLGYVLRSIPVGLGIGIFQSPNNSAIMGAAPRERLGVASGLLALTRSLGQTTGIATLGAVWAALTFSYAGAPVSGGATAAPAAAQMAALQNTFLIVTVLVAVALTTGLVAWRSEARRAALRRASVVGAPE
jgi:EmrB/QacA subfamily drug resistance transporter